MSDWHPIESAPKDISDMDSELSLERLFELRSALAKKIDITQARLDGLREALALVDAQLAAPLAGSPKENM